MSPWCVKNVTLVCQKCVKNSIFTLRVGINNELRSLMTDDCHDHEFQLQELLSSKLSNLKCNWKFFMKAYCNHNGKRINQQIANVVWCTSLICVVTGCVRGRYV